MDKIIKWLTRIVFTYVWPDGVITEDIAGPCKDFHEWIETIRYYLNYCDLNCLHIKKVRGFLAFLAYSMMKRRH